MEIGLFHRSLDLDQHENYNYTRIDFCGLGNNYDGNLRIRIVSIVVILIASCAGICFPLMTTRIKWLRLSWPVYYFIKFFGTGIIIATAWVHLLLPSFMELGFSPCLVGIWKTHNFAHVFSIVGFFIMFLLHIFSLRYIYTKYIKKSASDQSNNTQKQVINDMHHHLINDTQDRSTNDAYIHPSNNNEDPPMMHMCSANMLSSFEKQDVLNQSVTDDIEKMKLKKYIVKKNVVTFFMLEFGIIFHSIIIGLTLAVTSNKEFMSLFIAIVFHQFFEGLGLGVRLFDIFRDINSIYNWFFVLMYGLITPVSIAVGLLIKSVYNPRSATTIIVSGILDSFSGGILLFSGFIELLAGDYIMNSNIRNGSLTVLLYTLVCLGLGYCVMAFLGRWV